jgi:opacity protein-like surface antigen
VFSVRCAVLLLIAVGTLASAQRRFDISPFVGYRSSMTFYTAPDSQPGVKARLSDGASLGFAAGIRYDETAVIEFRFTRQNTSTTLNGTSVAPSFTTITTRLEQYHADFTREFVFDNAPGVRPFLNASVGATRISWLARTDTRFSFGIGGGVKYFPVKWFGLRLQAQWLPIWLNPELKGIACGGGCVIVLGGRLASQGEVSVGPTFSF